MAETTQTLHKGTRRAVLAFTSVSGGTDETDVTKVDISDVFPDATKVKINKVMYSIAGMAVKISFDHTADDTVLVLSGDGQMDFCNKLCGVDPGGMTDPASAGGTGDILFSTLGADLNDTYTVILDISPA